jgi:hypothetical protein
MSEQAMTAAGVLWIEVAPGPDEAALEFSRLRSGAKPIARMDAVAGSIIATSLDELEGSLAAISGAVAKALERVAPDEWSVEFGIGFKGTAGLPVIVSGETTANLKVTMSWRRR